MWNCKYRVIHFCRVRLVHARGTKPTPDQRSTASKALINSNRLKSSHKHKKRKKKRLCNTNQASSAFSKGENKLKNAKF